MFKRFSLISLVAILSLLFACTGKQGPTGPQGDKGDPGDPGTGTRIVYQSTAPANSQQFVVMIPEIDTHDMPSVTAYTATTTYPNSWFPIPLYVSGGPDLGACFIVETGKVTLVNCSGLLYKIVIVI